MSLAETLKPVQQQTPLPAYDPDKLEADLKDKLLESPTKALDNYIQQKLGPEIGRIYQHNINTSRRFLEYDEKRKATFGRYQGEIEKEVQSLPLNEKAYDEDVYQKAHDRVVARHMDEIINLKVEEAIAKISKKPDEVKKVPFSETQVNRPANKTTTYRLTQADMNEIQKMRSRGMDIDEKTYAVYKYGRGK